MIAAAAASFAGIPAAYEKTSRKSMLYVPPVLFTILSAAADGLNMYLGRGQQYAALFSAIVGIGYLIIIRQEKDA